MAMMFIILKMGAKQAMQLGHFYNNKLFIIYYCIFLSTLPAWSNVKSRSWMLDLPTITVIIAKLRKANMQNQSIVVIKF